MAQEKKRYICDECDQETGIIYHVGDAGLCEKCWSKTED